MSVLPANLKIYHITHVNNLPSLIESDCLWSDAQMIERGLAHDVVGMNTIKTRRLTDLSLTCHPHLKVGECVPFYFCPRSVMLYLLHKGNSPELAYQGGQAPILHLQVDLHKAIRWAERNDKAWAFTISNAGANYTEHYNDLTELRQRINWPAVTATDWRDPVVKEGKQAEFLLEECLPWHLIEEIGVRDSQMALKARTILKSITYQPLVSVRPEWYY